MAISQSGATKRKSTGGRRRASADKKKRELGSLPTNTTIAKEKDDRKTVHSGKVKVKHALYANVYNPETKKHQKVKMLTEKENPANRNYARQNIITRNATITTEIGDVKITSRPGQTGSVNAVLMKKK